MNRAQRIVVVVALGLALAFLGRWIVAERAVAWRALGAHLPVAHPGLRPWVRLLVWLALLAAWAAASVWILRSARAGPGSGPTTGGA